MLQVWFLLVFLWLAVFLPLATWLRRKSYRRGAPEQRLPTGRIYLRVILGQWLTAGGIVWVFWRMDIPLSSLGLVAPKWDRTLLLALALVPLEIFLTIRARQSLADPVKREKIRKRFEGMSLLVPMTDGEQRGWNLLSITAGICEEVLYRGFMGFYLGRWLPLWGVALAASFFFGCAHLYQGPRGALRTLVAGLVFWAAYLLTGSIVPGMVLHALVDVRSGRVLRRAFTESAPNAA